MSKKSHFRRPFDKWHGERVETLLKSERHHLYHIYWYLWRQLRLKTSLRGICKILGLFVNQLTADDKYSLLKRGNFQKHFQTDLSQKRKRISIFFVLFFAFSKFRLNYEQFEKKDGPHSSCFLELTN